MTRPLSPSKGPPPPTTGASCCSRGAEAELVLALMSFPKHRHHVLKLLAPRLPASLLSDFPPSSQVSIPSNPITNTTSISSPGLGPITTRLPLTVDLLTHPLTATTRLSSTASSPSQLIVPAIRRRPTTNFGIRSQEKKDGVQTDLHLPLPVNLSKPILWVELVNSRAMALTQS